jgi:hypothetical protein
LEERKLVSAITRLSRGIIEAATSVVAVSRSARRLPCIAVLTLSVAVSLFAAPQAKALMVVVDPFTETTLSAEVKRTTTGTTTVHDGSFASILGGTRSIALTLSSGTGPRTDTAMVYPAGVDSLFEFTSSALAKGTLDLTYGLFNPLNIDLTQLPALNVNFVAFDAPSLTGMVVTATITDGAAHSYSTAVNVTSTTPDTMTFDFSGVPLSFHLNDVDQIKLSFNVPKGGDFDIARLYYEVPEHVIPEPASMGLLALSGLGLLRRRR